MSDSLSLYESSSALPRIGLIEVPFELGSDARGLAEAPAYLRASGLSRMFEATGIAVASDAAIACPRGGASLEFPKFLTETADVARRTAERVRGMRRRGEVVVALCGDHASAIGTIAGAALAGERLGYIYIDAHPDMHTHETTVSGNTHAMVVSSAIGKGHERLTKIGGMSPKVRGEDVVFIGIKDFDEIEPRLIRESGARAVTALDIARHGIEPAITEIEALAQRVDCVWISMDMDAIDRVHAPGVAMPCEDGLTRREITSLAHVIGKTCAVAGLDIVEMKPANDIDGKTAALAIELIARFLGREYTWYRSYMQPYEMSSALVRERAQATRSRMRDLWASIRSFTARSRRT